MTRRAIQRTYRRPLRLAIALCMLVIATTMVVVEPFPNGPVLMALTARHGVDTGDLPAIVLCLVGAWLALR